jgi:hypothetical protein
VVPPLGVSSAVVAGVPAPYVVSSHLPYFDNDRKQRNCQGLMGGVTNGRVAFIHEFPRAEILGNRASDAAASPGDQSCLALKFAHASLLIHIAPIICNDRQRHYLPIFPALSPAIY